MRSLQKCASEWVSIPWFDVLANLMDVPKLDETTLGKIQIKKERQEREALEKAQEQEREDLKKATNNVVSRVLGLVRERKADYGTDDNPPILPIDSLDIALLTIKYGTFSEEGFFKILRNTNFGNALAISLIVGLVTWAISNITHILFSLPQ